MNSPSTTPHSLIETHEWTELHCPKDALTSDFGWLLQGILAGVAFTCLVGESISSDQLFNEL